MARAGDKISIQVVFLDKTVEMHISEDLTGSRSKVAEKTKLQVLFLKWFAKKRIFSQIDHTKCQVATGLEVVVVEINVRCT